MTKLFVSIFFLFAYVSANAQILPGAYNTQEYLPLLKDKNVGVFANQTSVIGNTHLVDSLQRLGIKITKIFGPEHGFRGIANAGENVDSYTDKQTGILVVSLYGKKSKPSADDLKDVDVLLFDLQDVGTRFYTYISSLQSFIEAAIDNQKPLIILDRPNPNGFYIDGPVLEKGYESGVGKQPVPVVYGMTIGEYGLMLIGEKWLSVAADYDPEKVSVKVIKCSNYTHSSRYVLPVKPSPNLPGMPAVYWYPSTCFFEGTVLSEGRGTIYPFQIFGHPALPDSLFRFVPESMPGATDPKLKGLVCYGWNVHEITPPENKIELRWLLQAYQLFPDKDKFFLPAKSGKLTDMFFNKLAGNSELMQQIKDGKTEAEIRASWQPALEKFKKIRAKYLLYND
jgi:uncharacterized protein YbbC (DUF1343 family)